MPSQQQLSFLAFIPLWPIVIEPLPHIGALPLSPPQQSIASAGAEPITTMATAISISFFTELFSSLILAYQSMQRWLMWPIAPPRG
ncbi:hypothetical protein [Methylobacterium sp. CM6247]